MYKKIGNLIAVIIAAALVIIIILICAKVMSALIWAIAAIFTGLI